LEYFVAGKYPTDIILRVNHDFMVIYYKLGHFLVPKDCFDYAAKILGDDIGNSACLYDDEIRHVRLDQA
jgi:hypothetical protein